MSVKNLPKNLQPVLAKIQHQGDLGLSTWYEVVFYDDMEPFSGWKSYSGSNTFDDGEQVVEWKYVTKIELTNK